MTEIEKLALISEGSTLAGTLVTQSDQHTPHDVERLAERILDIFAELFIGGDE